MISPEHFRGLNQFEQRALADMQEHNWRLAGEENKPVLLERLWLMPGFEIEDLLHNRWRVMTLREQTVQVQAMTRSERLRWMNKDQFVYVPKRENGQ